MNTNFYERKQSLSFCFVDFSVSISVDVISIMSNTNFYERKQSFCFNVDVVCIFLVVVNTHATFTLTVDMIMKKSVRMSFSNSVVNLISKSKHKRLSKMKIKS